MTYAEVIGERVSLLRKRLGLTAAKLAERTGISRSVIANLESGRKSDVTVAELVSLAWALHTSPVFLLVDIDEPDARALAFPDFASTDEDLVDFGTNYNFARWFTAQSFVFSGPEVRQYQTLIQLMVNRNKKSSLLWEAGDLIDKGMEASMAIDYLKAQSELLDREFKDLADEYTANGGVLPQSYARDDDSLLFFESWFSPSSTRDDREHPEGAGKLAAVLAQMSDENRRAVVEEMKQAASQASRNELAKDD